MPEIIVLPTHLALPCRAGCYALYCSKYMLFESAKYILLDFVCSVFLSGRKFHSVRLPVSICSGREGGGAKLDM